MSEIFMKNNLEEIFTLKWEDDTLTILDQRYLPDKILYETVLTIQDVFEAIKKLRIRGAPAIGVIAAFGLYLGTDGETKEEFINNLFDNRDYLLSSRPTAVNLKWALDKVCSEIESLSEKNVNTLRGKVLEIALRIKSDDERVCSVLGEHGASLINDEDRILTHCNAGKLATMGLGTALAAIYVAHSQGKKIKVYADETRPVLQGSRLTAFELSRAGIDTTLICDNMAASLMAKGMIDMIIVGADRVTANGDVCNKIGTYQLACLARMHYIPFYVSCPLSTIDTMTFRGRDIIIEERDSSEVTSIQEVSIAPGGIEVYNPAFDVTPSAFVTGIITEAGILRAPYVESIAGAMNLITSETIKN